MCAQAITRTKPFAQVQGADRKTIWINPYLVNYGPDTTIDPPTQFSSVS